MARDDVVSEVVAAGDSEHDQKFSEHSLTVPFFGPFVLRNGAELARAGFRKGAA
jgi:hypothetical protein